MRGEKLIVVLLFAISFAIVVNCYSSGAPVSDEICASLRPNHPGEPQSIKFPYQLQVNKRSVSPLDEVTLSIIGRSQPFKGFLVQGRRKQFDKETTPMGTFTFTNEMEKELQGIDCLNQENSAVTHRNGDEKRNVTIIWKAPKEKGTYLLL